VYGHNDGFATILDCGKQVLKGCSTRLTNSYLAKLLNVGASYKRASAADEYDGDSIVFVEPRKSFHNALGHAGTESVNRGILMVMTAMSLSRVTWTSSFIYHALSLG
jgi:hypothetical protein